VPLEPDHTRVELEHRGWERLGAQGRESRAGYDSGWPGVLESFATTVMGASSARSLPG
jgi:hypothetical protein